MNTIEENNISSDMDHTNPARDRVEERLNQIKFEADKIGRIKNVCKAYNDSSILTDQFIEMVMQIVYEERT